MTENNQLIDIWKNINISTMFFLKLFDEGVNKKRHTIHSYCFSGGLINCFLDKSHEYLHLLFDKEVATSFNNPDFKQDGHYSNVIDRLIDNPNFNSIHTYEGLIRVSFKIPSIFKGDINKIVEKGAFSKTSEAFKQRMKVPDVVEFTANEKAKFLVTNNFAYRVVIQSESLSDQIKNSFGVKSMGQELYKKFDPIKEYWDESKLIELYG